MIEEKDCKGTILDTVGHEKIRRAMNVKISNVLAASIEAAEQPNRIHVNIEGVKIENILSHIDILTAIDYYGMTEFLDLIGEDRIRFYLSLGK